MPGKDDQDFELNGLDESLDPGYCVGHYDESDASCAKCDIQDSCKDVTADLESQSGIEGEKAEEGNDNAKKENQ